MTGLTVEGFLGKRLPEIKADLEAEFVAQFGVDLNLSSETILGQLIGIESEARSDFWAEIENVYQSQYPSTASGAALDLVVDINGLSRLPALPTTVTGYLTLTVGTLVEAGRKAKDGSTTYTLLDDVTGSASTSHGATIGVDTVADATDYSVTIDGGVYTYTSGVSATVSTILTGLAAAMPVGVTIALGESSLTLSYDGPAPIVVSTNLALSSVVNAGGFECDTTGPVALPIGALDEIETPVAGWSAVTNRAAGTLGRNVENDAELRVRRSESVRLRAVSTVDGITAQLRQTDGVTDAIVYENSGEVTDANGVPRQHIWCIVEGGEASDIADVIYRRKAGGIGTFGDTTALAISEVTGQAFEMRFSRPTVTPVYITVNIEGSASLPTDYIATVREALVAHGEGLEIGENLILNRLYTPSSLAIDDESYVSSITLGTSPSPVGTLNLFASPDERFQIVAENIDVLVN